MIPDKRVKEINRLAAILRLNLDDKDYGAAHVIVGELDQHLWEFTKLEVLWERLGDVPVDDDGIIQTRFESWFKGTDREEIWHWFDERYPGGVAKLMGRAVE